MIKAKISDNLYDIYLSDKVPIINYRFYRGDFFSFTVKGFNPDNTKFNFRIYDTFRAQIRSFDEQNTQVHFDFEVGNPFKNTISDEVILGKSDLDDPEFDILSLSTADGLSFPFHVPIVWIDIEGVLIQPFPPHREEKKTLFKIRCELETDVTRV